MYFPLFKLHGWGKRSGIQPKTIYSELPKALPPLLSRRSAPFVSAQESLSGKYFRRQDAIGSEGFGSRPKTTKGELPWRNWKEP